MAVARWEDESALDFVCGMMSEFWWQVTILRIQPNNPYSCRIGSPRSNNDWMLDSIISKRIQLLIMNNTGCRLWTKNNGRCKIAWQGISTHCGSFFPFTLHPSLLNLTLFKPKFHRDHHHSSYPSSSSLASLPPPPSSSSWTSSPLLAAAAADSSHHTRHDGPS